MHLERFSKNSFLVAGRAGMDLYAEPPGTRVEEATHFLAALGGSSANCAAAIVRLGGKASLLTTVSDDAVGRFVIRQLADYGIAAGHIQTIGGEARNSLAVVETRSENCQSVIYRNNAADFHLAAEPVRKIGLGGFGAVVMTGTGLALEPSRSTCMELLRRARGENLAVIFDVDYRPYSWTSRNEASEISGKAAELADILVGNNEEFDLLAQEKEGGLVYAKSISDRHSSIVIYKMGERGSVTFAGGKSFETPVFKVAALKPTGAGDAFLGAFCTSLASGQSLQDSVRRGSAAAAIVVTKVGCAPASPSPQELELFMRKHAPSFKS